MDTTSIPTALFNDLIANGSITLGMGGHVAGRIVPPSADAPRRGKGTRSAAMTSGRGKMNAVRSLTGASVLGVLPAKRGLPISGIALKLKVTTAAVRPIVVSLKKSNAIRELPGRRFVAV